MDGSSWTIFKGVSLWDQTSKITKGPAHLLFSIGRFLVSYWTIRGISHSLQDRSFTSICTSYNQDSELDILERTAGLSYTHRRVVHRGDHILLDDASLVRLRLRVFVPHIAGLDVAKIDAMILQVILIPFGPTPSFFGASQSDYKNIVPTLPTLLWIFVNLALQVYRLYYRLCLRLPFFSPNCLHANTQARRRSKRNAHRFRRHETSLRKGSTVSWWAAGFPLNPNASVFDVSVNVWTVPDLRQGIVLFIVRL